MGLTLRIEQICGAQMMQSEHRTTSGAMAIHIHPKSVQNGVEYSLKTI